MGVTSVGRFVRDGSRLPIALAVAMTLLVALLAWLQWRSISDLRSSSAAVLRQLSRHAADSIAREIENTLQKPRTDLFVRLTPAVLQPFDSNAVQRILTEALAAHPLVTRVYVWSERPGVPEGRLLAVDRERPALHASRPEAAALLHGVRELSRQKQPRTAFVLDIDGRPAYVQAQIRYHDAAREQIASFFAFAADAGQLRHEFFPALLTRLAAGWQTPAGFPPLTVALLDGDGRLLFPDGGSAALPYEDERSVPLLFLTDTLLQSAAFAAPPEVWRLRTGYGDRTIDEIVAARERPQRAVLLLLAAMTAAGIVCVARAAAAEARLAQRKSDFVLSVSHDLRTPLAHIRLFAESLELGRAPSPARAQEYARIIGRQADRLSRLIDTILDFSRIEAGRRAYTRERQDLVALARQALEAFDTPSGFTIQLSAPSSPVWVPADGQAARQAIENLVSNAVKYSGTARAVRVVVDQLSGFGRVRVIDRGAGIPRALQRKIFRKFFRTADAARSGAPGCGLGLAIVDHVMRAHHGSVSVESEPGRGSTFTLHFPIERGDLAHDEADSGHRGRAADVARPA